MPYADTLMQTADKLTNSGVDSLTSDTLSAVQNITDTISSSILSVAAPSGFEGIALAPQMGNSALITILILLLFPFFGYIIISRRSLLIEMINDFFFIKERSSIFMDASSNQGIILIYAICLFIGSGGLFLYAFFFDNIPPLLLNLDGKTIALVGMLLFTTLFLIGKRLLFFFLGYVFFDNDKTYALYSRSYFTIMFALGIALYPIVVGLAFAPHDWKQGFLIAGILLAIISFILLLYKTIQIFLFGFRSFLYIILYLCILEILPFLILSQIAIRL